MKKINLTLFALCLCISINSSAANQSGSHKTRKPFFLVALTAYACHANPCADINKVPLTMLTQNNPAGGYITKFFPRSAVDKCPNENRDECLTEIETSYNQRYFDCTGTLPFSVASPSLVHALEVRSHLLTLTDQKVKDQISALTPSKLENEL